MDMHVLLRLSKLHFSINDIRNYIYQDVKKPDTVAIRNKSWNINETVACFMMVYGFVQIKD